MYLLVQETAKQLGGMVEGTIEVWYTKVVSSPEHQSCSLADRLEMYKESFAEHPIESLEIGKCASWPPPPSKLLACEMSTSFFGSSFSVFYAQVISS